MSSIGKLILPILCLLCFLLSPGRVVLASDNLLQNSQFSSFDGNFPSWIKNVSTLNLEASESGVVLKSNSTSTKYIYQLVSATPSANYRLSAKILYSQGNLGAYLRVTQCATVGCSTSKEEIKSTDSPHVDNPSDTDLNLDFTTATNAVSLKIKLSLDPKDSSISSLLWNSPNLEFLAETISTSSALEVALEASDSALTIDYALPASVSAGSEFTLPVSLKFAKSNTAYYMKGLGGVASSSADWRSIVIKGSDSSWLAWNGSWNKMPTLLTDSQGVATASLTVKFSTHSTLGVNNFLVRIREEGTEENIDSGNQTIGVDPAPEEQSSLVVKQPLIDWTLPPAARIGEPFKLKAKLIAQPNIKYLVKLRGGKDGSSWVAASTQNNGNFLSDTATWSKFPEVLTNSKGEWEGEIVAQIKDNYEAGNYQLYLRIRDPNVEENFDSGVQVLPVEGPSTKGEASEEATTTSGIVLGTVSPSPTLVEQPPFPILIVPKREEEALAPHARISTVPEVEGFNLVAGGLALVGLTILGSFRLPQARKPDPVSQQSSLWARQLLPIGKLH